MKPHQLILDSGWQSKRQQSVVLDANSIKWVQLQPAANRGRWCSVLLLSKPIWGISGFKAHLSLLGFHYNAEGN